MQIQHGEVDPAEVRLVCCSTGIAVLRSVVRIVAAPNAIPKVRVGFGKVGERIAFPLLPGRGRISVRESPYQSLVEGRPDSASFESTSLGLGTP